MVEIHSANYSLHDIAQHIIALLRSIITGLLAKTDKWGKANLPRDVCAGYARHKCVQAMGQATFGFILIPMIEHVSDDQSQDAIAEKFKPLIVRLPRTAMRQCALIQRDILGWLRK